MSKFDLFKKINKEDFELIELKPKVKFDPSLYEQKNFEQVTDWQDLLTKSLELQELEPGTFELKNFDFNPLMPNRDEYENFYQVNSDEEVLADEWPVSDFMQFSPNAENSVAVGNLGNDALIGNDNDNYMVGGREEDMFGGGQYIVESTPDDDIMYGFGGQDQMFGGCGNDYMDGGTGWDYLVGGDNNDILDGGRDTVPDHMEGGQGTDLLIGRSHGDVLIGGTEQDTFYIMNAGFSDTTHIRDFADVGDRVILDDSLRGNGYQFRQFDFGDTQFVDVYDNIGRTLFSFNYTDGMTVLYDETGFEVANGNSGQRGVTFLGATEALSDNFNLV